METQVLWVRFTRYDIKLMVYLRLNNLVDLRVFCLALFRDHFSASFFDKSPEPFKTFSRLLFLLNHYLSDQIFISHLLHFAHHCQ